MNNKAFRLFFVISFIFCLTANLVHPVTPTLIVERGLDSSMFGTALAAMMLMNFIFSPLWGKLCGFIPTKTIMLIGCLGYSIGQVVFGFADIEWKVMIGRMFAGIFIGGIYTAFYNYILNVSGNDTELRNSTLVTNMTIQSVASAIGYFIGGMIGLISVEFAFSCQVVLLIISGILFYSFCQDDNKYKEITENSLTIQDINPFRSFLEARKYLNPVIILLFLITSISAIGQNSYEQCFNYYIKDQFSMTSAYNGTFKAIIAVLTLIINSTVCMYIQKHTDIKKSFILIMIIILSLNGSILIIHNQIYFISIYIIYSVINVLRVPLLQSMIANRTNFQNSNSIMGLYNSMNSFGGIFGAACAGLIYSKGKLLPFIISFIAYFTSLVIGFIVNKKMRLERDRK